jgi:hypothetical protein
LLSAGDGLFSVVELCFECLEFGAFAYKLILELGAFVIVVVQEYFGVFELCIELGAFSGDFALSFGQLVLPASKFAALAVKLASFLVELFAKLTERSLLFLDEPSQ